MGIGDWILIGFLVAVIMALAVLDMTFEFRKERTRRKMYLEVARKRKLTRK